MNGQRIARLERVVRRRAGFTLGPISLALDAGVWTGLSGRSGAGKTTLLEILAGLDRADSGQVELFGQDATHASEGQLAALRRQGIGYVYQESRLIEHLSVWQNVSARLVPQGVPTRERRQRAVAALDALGIAQLSSRLPRAISGGERQRVAVARALVANPRLVLADEPTASVDGETGALILEQLTACRERGAALLVSSHDPSAHARADVHIALTRGALEKEAKRS